MVLSLKVNGIPGVQRKLNPSVLYAPAIAEGMETFRKRIGRPRKSRKGGTPSVAGRANTITSEASSLMASASTTLIPPRTSGGSWMRALVAAVKKMESSVSRSIVRKIVKGWSK